MTDIPFHQTRMGQQFFERTLPELVRQIERLTDAVDEEEAIRREWKPAFLGCLSDSASVGSPSLAGRGRSSRRPRTPRLGE